MWLLTRPFRGRNWWKTAGAISAKLIDNFNLRLTWFCECNISYQSNWERQERQSGCWLAWIALLWWGKGLRIVRFQNGRVYYLFKIIDECGMKLLVS
jgi:hypothetical protein